MEEKFLPTSPRGRLEHTAEECGEVVKEIMKGLRFGLAARWPREGGPTNAAVILKEIGDLERSIAWLKPDLERIIEITSPAKPGTTHGNIIVPSGFRVEEVRDSHVVAVRTGEEPRKEDVFWSNLGAFENTEVLAIDIEFPAGLFPFEKPQPWPLDPRCPSSPGDVVITDFRLTPDEERMV